ncbi:MAG TPA: VIT1/CCC1 transporter family protein, partial [Trebonia sp.]|nr:VIT1/CCC1 transporter family protein [Trebonia sp.]
MDDLGYFPDGLWPADDVAYRDYAVSGGARAGGRHHRVEQPGSVWQQLADGPWSPLVAPVADQVYPPQGQQSWDSGGGWPGLPPGSGPWPAQGAWNGTVRDDPYGTTDYPQVAYGPGYGPAPSRPPRDSRPYERPRDDRPRVDRPRDDRLWEDRLRDDRPRDDRPRGDVLRDSGPRQRLAPGGVLRDSGPRQRLAPDDVRRTTGGTSLLAGYAPGTGPMRRVPSADEPTEPHPRPSSPRSYGKPMPDWLPFGNRLVLLPKEVADDGEVPREHRDVSGGWLRPAVFGAMDGVVTNASLIAGIGGGGGGHGAIVLTGIAGLIAGAFSMATGEYISVKSQNELTQAEVELERRQHARDRGGKLNRLTQLFMDKGVSPNLAEAVARQISADPDRAVETHVREELGIDPDDLPSPRTAAVASFLSFTVGALIPLAPFLIGVPSLPAA